MVTIKIEDWGGLNVFTYERKDRKNDCKYGGGNNSISSDRCNRYYI